MFQPDIPQNVGAMMRLSACMGVALHIIEPCGFPWNPRKIQQSAMDYAEHVQLHRHASWEDFLAAMPESRLLLMTTHANTPYLDIEFQAGDILLAGSESSGAPDFVHHAAAARIGIPMQNGLRSLNIVNATSMILGEGLRQVR